MFADLIVTVDSLSDIINVGCLGALLRSLPIGYWIVLGLYKALRSTIR